ncbi:hypothetical protein SDC9_89726 [bioreactor metagenome]|uniref:Uncharacterized protein n=1 Tax=bioreactor metagenome TaxID=1076179 RepID=A0A644ZWN0_9ZZZZ
MATDLLLPCIVEEPDLTGIGHMQATTGDGVHILYNHQAHAIPFHLDGSSQSELLCRSLGVHLIVHRMRSKDLLIDQVFQ